MMRITLKQLEVFAAVARTGNMTQAAEAVHLTQSACSMALTNLETQLATMLFDRHGKKLILNDQGRLLFSPSINILTQVNELENLLVQAAAGDFTVGASTTIGNYLMPKIIGTFMDTYPNAHVTLRIGNTENVIQQVLKFQVDMGLIEGSCYSDEIEVLPWKEDKLIIIAAKKHELAAKKKLTLADLHKAKWILREAGSGTRERFEEAMDNNIHPFMELGHTEAIKQAVLEGLGISCVSKAAVTSLLQSHQLVELPAPFLKLNREFSIILHKAKHRTALLNKFISHLI